MDPAPIVGLRAPSVNGGRDPLRVILAVLCAASLLFTCLPLRHGDLNLDYPFMDGDSHDWIANGLFLAGHDVRYSGRPPLLPLTIALLDRLGSLPWLPVLLQVLFHVTVLAFYSLAASYLPRRAAFAAALALLLNHSLRGISLQVMADLPASCLLLLATRAFLLAEDRPRSYARAGLLAGLASLTQQVTALWAPAAAITLLARRRHHLRDRHRLPLLGGFLFFAGLQAAWILWKWTAVGTSGDHLVRQWGLLQPHTGSVLFYAEAWASLLGLPAGLLAVAGLFPAVWAVWAARHTRDGAPRIFSLVLLASLLAFFVFLYDFNAKRFLVYAVWPAGLLLAEALGRLRRTAVFAALSGVAVLGSALPLPAAGSEPAWAAVWPLPPVLSHTPLQSTPSGGANLGPGPISLEVRPLDDLVRWSTLYQVWNVRAGQASPPRRISPEETRLDRSALFLYREPSDGGGRYRTITRLGNALHKKVKFVPRDWLEPWHPFLEIHAAGLIEPDYALYRIRLPETAGTWLLAAPADGPLRRELDARAGRPPLPAPPGMAAGRRKARAMRRYIQGGDSYVALLPARHAGDPSHLYLPFVLETTELRVIAPEDEATVLALVAAAPARAERSFGTTRVRKFHFLERDSALVLYARENGVTGTAAPPRPPPAPPRPARRAPPARRAAKSPAG